MRVAVVYILLMVLTWCLIHGEFSVGQVLLGLLFGVGIVVGTRAGFDSFIPLRELPVRTANLLLYALVLLPYDIVLSNIDLAKRLLRKQPDIEPGIIRNDLTGETEQTAAIIAHGITMTPGEMVVDFSRDGRILYVHVMHVSDTLQNDVRLWQLYRRLLGKVFPC